MEKSAPNDLDWHVHNKSLSTSVREISKGALKGGASISEEETS